MGRKGHGKSSGKGLGNPVASNNTNSQPKVLSRQKRNDLNQLVDRLLKVSSAVQATPSAAKDWENHLEIERLLDKINVIESWDAKATVDDRGSHFEEFVTWMTDNGADIGGVKIAKFPEYEYGLQAVKDFNEGDLLIAVPRKLMITVENVKDSVLGPLLRKDAMLKHMPNVTLSLLLLVEKLNPDSFYKPYISILPGTYNTVLYCKSKELLELKGSPSLESALKQCQNIARQYAYLNKLFQTTSDPASNLLRDHFTYQQYCWAVSTVMTRQNFVPGVGADEDTSMINALIPMWDMCNHSNGALSTDFAMAKDRSECLAFRPFSSGEQVFIFYGTRSNSDLFVHNGFVYPANEDDALRIRLGVSRADPLQPIRRQLLTRLGLPTNGEFLLKNGTEPVDGRLLAFLRVFSMGQDQLDHWLASERYSDLMYADCALETEVEMKTWNFLLARIKLLLSAYPTTIQSDEEQLERPGLTACQRLAVELRLTEKKILRGSQEYVQQRIKP